MYRFEPYEAAAAARRPAVCRAAYDYVEAARERRAAAAARRDEVVLPLGAVAAIAAVLWAFLA